MNRISGDGYKQGAERKLILSLYFYWFILVLWQNMGSYMASSAMALALKLGLVAMLTAIFFVRKDTCLRFVNLFFWSLFCLHAVFLFATKEKGFGGTTLIYYIFPVLFSFLTLVCQSGAQVDKKSYLLFLRLVVATVAYMALYSLIFQTEHFTSFLRLERSYGNELSSFFLSNHEYGMYLVFGITAVMVWYQNTEKRGVHILQLLLLLLFGVNLLVTLSRTSMLACGVMVLVFVFFSKKNGVKKWFLFFIAVVLLALIFTPGSEDFISTILMKENNDAGRFDMWQAAVEKFQSGNTVQRLFGWGHTNIEVYLQRNFLHNTVHNMFLQTLLVWGIAGLTFQVGIIASSIVSAVRLWKKDRNMCAIFLALSFSAVAFMFTNTACIMQSPIDSFMLTVFTVIVPKYVANAIHAGTYATD